MLISSRIEDFTDGFDPFTALLTIGGEGDITNPLPELSRLRRQSPVVEGDLHEHFGAPRQVTLVGYGKSYMVLSHAACREVTNNRADYASAINLTHVGLSIGKGIVTMDPPDHPKYRPVFQAAFTPKMLGALTARFKVLINRLVGGFEDQGKADLVQAVALHFPAQFICDLMDLPDEDRPLFQKLAIAQNCVGFDPAHGIEASQKLGRYLCLVMEERRGNKSDTDLLSVLVNSEVEGEPLPQAVLLGFFRMLMSAGGDTSYHGFSNILAGLFTHPDQLEAVLQDRSLVPQAIEEGLRWGGPLTAIDRNTTRDVVLEGVPIEKNAALRVCIAAANHDESVWAEPEKFNIFREPKRHLGFGHGPHVCVGQHVARMELQMALNTIVDRLTNVRLDPDMPPPVIRGLTFRGADAVHVKWDAQISVAM